MDLNGSLRPNFDSQALESPTSGFLYNSNLAQCPVLEMKQPQIAEEADQQVLVEKKKRLSYEQLEALERSFQEEIKLDPDRKMKLSKELSLQPRQIAVWFQNRRARWKAKQIELLYHALKQDYDAISTEKLKLQEEVIKLRTMLREQAARNQVSTAYTDVSGEEMEEIKSMAAVRSSNSYVYRVEDFSQISAAPFWGRGAEAQLSSYP